MRSTVIPGFLLLLAGCTSNPEHDERRHVGAKVNLSNFLKNTSEYKGRLVSLELQVDEEIDKNRGRTLKDFVGKNVKFTTVTKDGQSLNIAISIPADLEVPEAGKSERVFVTFVCTQGNLKQGNQAKVIDFP
jgi:hypothetical protein